MGEYGARALRAGAIAGVDAATLYVDAVRAGHADAQAALLQEVRDAAGRRGLAVGAGDGNHRNARVIAGSEHGIHDGLAHGAALAAGRLDVHAQAGCRVHFDDCTAALLERLGHVGRHDVHACDIETDHAGCLDRALGNARMYRVGDVCGGAASAQVRVATQHHQRAGRGYAVDGERLFGQGFAADLVQQEFAQGRGVIFTPARIEVRVGD